MLYQLETMSFNLRHLVCCYESTQSVTKRPQSPRASPQDISFPTQPQIAVELDRPPRLAVFLGSSVIDQQPLKILPKWSFPTSIFIPLMRFTKYISMSLFKSKIELDHSLWFGCRTDPTITAVPLCET